MIDGILTPGPGKGLFGNRKPKKAGKSKLGKAVAKEHNKARKNLTKSFQPTVRKTNKVEASAIPEIPSVGGGVKDTTPRAKNQDQIDRAIKKFNAGQ